MCFPPIKQALGPVFLTKVEKSLSGLSQLHTLMTADTNSIRIEETISFLNRDHIIAVVVHHGEIVVTTTGGEKIRIPVSRAILEKFLDDLANHVESNFVSIASATLPETIAVSD